jgi:hypothetical protein
VSGRDERVELLLASDDDRRPVLGEGLPGDAVGLGPKPKKASGGADAHERRQRDANPNDLPLQRWGIVAPEGREGSRLLEAMAPLIALREEEQGAPVTVFRVPAGMDAKHAVAWKDEVYGSEDVAEEDRPAYLLMVGDLEQTSLELQHCLANDAFVGRVHFEDHACGEADLEGYATYAGKVVRLAREATAESAPDLLFFVAPDGTAATVQGDARLVAPGMEASEQSLARGKLPTASIRRIEAESVDGLLAGGADRRPSVLLSVSHGMGAPRRGWASEEVQRRRQGSLLVAPDEVLDAERLQNQAFLPGGFWFCFACFGAGTPQVSAYQAWLSVLAKDGAYRGKVDAVLTSLPRPGGRPFLAAMPQAALRNPEGPLAVIGHVDLAWTYAFSSATNLAESRKSRVISALDVLVRGSRAGVALDALVQYYRETNDALMALYQLEADARMNARPDPTNPEERAHLWMLRNDLRGYILLGDPATRLPLAQNASRPVPRREGAPAARATNIAVNVKESAVHALIRGDTAPLAIAASAGTTLEELFAWFDAYRAGGRGKLQD